ncbi:MAG: hypothetical protein AB7K09_24420 [Planctomycetota bacterium]
MTTIIITTIITITITITITTTIMIMTTDRVRATRRRGRHRVLASIALLALAATLVGCPMVDHGRAEMITLFGVSDYSPVPSDGLAIRQADTDGRERLAVAVQGYRYQLINGRFALAPGVFAESSLSNAIFISRDAVRIGDLMLFISRVGAEQSAVWNATQRAELAGGRRYELLLTLSPGGDIIQLADGSGIAVPVTNEPGGELSVQRLRDALETGLRQSLRLHHREGALQASGRIFLINLEPELVTDPLGKVLPRDPGDSATRDPEYRYRLGSAMVPTTGRSLRMRLSVIVLTDRLF